MQSLVYWPRTDKGIMGGYILDVLRTREKRTRPQETRVTSHMALKNGAESISKNAVIESTLFPIIWPKMVKLRQLLGMRIRIRPSPNQEAMSAQDCICTNS